MRVLARSIFLALIGATPPAWGQIAPFGLHALRPANAAPALRQSLEEAWSVVSPRPASENTGRDVSVHQSLPPPAEKADAQSSQRVIRRKAGTDPVGPAESNNPTETGSSIGGSWVRTLGSLAGVVAIILFLSWGAKSMRNVGGSFNRPRKAGLIEVISRTSISPKQSLCLVRVGPRMVLIGVTQERLQALDVITDPEVVSGLAGAAVSVQRVTEDRAFVNRLEKEGARYLENEATASAATDTESANALRDRLRNSVARLRQAAAKK